jgi:UDP-N-acetylmuramyl tripeptide synthase
MAEGLGLRDHMAIATMRVVNTASRRTGRGEGTVVGGRVALRVSPSLLERLSSPMAVALVTGTNGKTTTTACLAAALRTRGDVATNATGSNMLPGHTAALAASSDATCAALECDEVWLPRALEVERPSTVVLLNLSRDQLDRTAEVRRTADTWRRVLEGFAGTCVANADDPLVVHAALEAPSVAWFAGGLVWGDDAIACPRCARGIVYDERGWSCACGFARPSPDARPTETGALLDGVDVAYETALPGAFNRANGVGALLAAVRMGVEPLAAARAVGSVTEVAGRFSELAIDGVPARLMLAKNPAGWRALLDLLGADRCPVVVAVNARVADGHDPSWLYDVDFERLRGRRVLAAGERWRDLSTRLFYAEVDHDCEPDSRRAIAMAGDRGERVEVIANYTAFADLRRSDT